jgi:carbonic anhydrase
LYGCSLDPAKYAGLSEGDAHVIRNAGGRASDDAIRSLIISYKLLGTAEWFVIHHTDCGMELLQMILSEIYLQPFYGSRCKWMEKYY